MKEEPEGDDFQSRIEVERERDGGWPGACLWDGDQRLQG